MQRRDLIPQDEDPHLPGGANGDVAPIRRPRRPTRIPAGASAEALRSTTSTISSPRTGPFAGELAEQYPHGQSAKCPDRPQHDPDFRPDGGRGSHPAADYPRDKTGIWRIRQMQIYSKGGWIVVCQISDGGTAIPQDTFLGVWSIYDNGDVAPRMEDRRQGGNIMVKPRGVTLNPNHKEVCFRHAPERRADFLLP